MESSPSPPNQSQLLKAVKGKDLTHAWQHLNSGGDPNLCDASNASLLHLACKEGNVALAMLLFTKGANLNALDDLARTPLHVAASVGNFQIVAFLVKAGADVGAKDKDGQLAEEAALAHNQLAVYQFLAGCRRGSAVPKAEQLAEARGSLKSIQDSLPFEKSLKKGEKKEKRLIERDVHLKNQLAELSAEKERLEALPEAQLGKREKLQIQELDRKMAKLDEKYHRNSAKIRRVRASSFERQADKGQAWLDYLIN